MGANDSSGFTFEKDANIITTLGYPGLVCTLTCKSNRLTHREVCDSNCFYYRMVL